MPNREETMTTGTTQDGKSETNSEHVKYVYNSFKVVPLPSIEAVGQLVLSNMVPGASPLLNRNLTESLSETKAILGETDG